jgi:hypothetical protein
MRKQRIYFKPEKFVVFSLETLCDRAFPKPYFDSGGQNPCRKPNFLQEAKKEKL